MTNQSSYNRQSNSHGASRTVVRASYAGAEAIGAGKKEINP